MMYILLVFTVFATAVQAGREIRSPGGHGWQGNFGSNQPSIVAARSSGWAGSGKSSASWDYSSNAPFGRNLVWGAHPSGQAYNAGPNWGSYSRSSQPAWQSFSGRSGYSNQGWNGGNNRYTNAGSSWSRAGRNSWDSSSW